jgi:hypothetical protein
MARPPKVDRAFDALYDPLVADREYIWTDVGKADAARNGVTEHEVVDALYSPQRIEHEIGSLLLAVAGLAQTARVVTVLCERIGPIGGYAILTARPATPEEIKEWTEGTQ